LDKKIFGLGAKTGIFEAAEGFLVGLIGCGGFVLGRGV